MVLFNSIENLKTIVYSAVILTILISVGSVYAIMEIYLFLKNDSPGRVHEYNISLMERYKTNDTSSIYTIYIQAITLVCITTTLSAN